MKNKEKVSGQRDQLITSSTVPALQSSDFQILFDSVPDPNLVLDPGLNIIYANNAYLRATGTKLGDIVGLDVFEVFPDNPSEVNSTAVANLNASFRRVLDNRQTDIMWVQKYDIPRRDGNKGFEERYWSPINTPVLDSANEIRYIIHRAVDVTEYIRLLQHADEKHQLNTDWHIQTEQMAAEIFTRCEEVSKVNSLLKRTKLELKQARDDLERQVEERTASLLLTNQQLYSEIDERKRAEQECHIQQSRAQGLLHELTIAEERERARIAGELHDHVGHCLLLGKLKIDKLANQSPSDIDIDEVVEISELIDQSILDIRSLTFQLRPPILSTAGLEAAVRWLVKEMRENLGLEVELIDDRNPKPLSYEIRSALFQSIRELLQNVAKHAGTARAKVSLKRESDFIVIVIEDSGKGFDIEEAKSQQSKPPGFGLFNIEQKIEFMDGCFMLNSEPGKGTSITLMVPLEKTTTLKGDSNEP